MLFGVITKLCIRIIKKLLSLETRWLEVDFSISLKGSGVRIPTQTGQPFRRNLVAMNDMSESGIEYIRWSLMHILIILINLNKCLFFYPHNGLYTEIHLPNLQVL